MANITREDANRSFFVFVKDTNTSRVKRVAIPCDFQVGTLGSPSELQLTGRLSLATANFVGSAANNNTWNASAHDTVICASGASTTGKLSVVLPASPRDGQLHVIKDVSGTANTVPITITAASTTSQITLIDGLASLTLNSARTAVCVVWFNSSWNVLINTQINNSIIATITGSTFTGPVWGQAGLTGSLQFIDNVGTSYLVAGSNITIVTQSNGQILISSTGGGGGGSSGSNQPWVDGINKIKTSGSVSIDFDNHFATDYGTDNFLFVSGSKNVQTGPNRHVATFGGDVIVSGSITGSIQQILPGLSYLVAGSNVTIVSQSNGQIAISATSGGGSSLPKTDNYTICAGVQQVNQSIFQAIAAFEFNPTGAETMSPSGSTTYTAFFQPIVEVFPTGVTLETQLYNVGLNSYVANSLLSSSIVTATRLKSVNLSGSLVSGSNTYEMHMRITNANAGKATCKGAKLFVTWA